MLGIVVPIIISIYVYRQAKETGRNAPLWAIVNFAVIFGVQIFIGLALGLILMFGAGWSEEAIDNLSLPIGLLAFVVSLVCSYFFVVRTVTRIPDNEFNAPPPPPPQFH